MYRFFIKEEQIHDGMIEICGSDVNHIKNVLRMKTGDKVLIEFCLIVNSIIDDETIFGRIGGEEFCITFLDKDIETVENIAEKIRNNCADKQIILENNEILNFTISMGLSCRDNFDDIDKILQKSDELLYEAKETGRNRLIRVHR